jgi:hypothetical protein
MSSYDRFKTDKNFEIQGVCFEEPTFRYWLARTGGANKKFQQVFEKLSRPHRRQIAAEILPEKTSQKILWQTYAQTVIKRWEVKVDKEGNTNEEKGEWKEGFERVNGEVVLGPVQEEHLIELFKEVPQFFSDLMADSTNMQYYVIDQAETDAKNL